MKLKHLIPRIRRTGLTMKISDLSDCASVALFLAELISIYIDFLTALGSSCGPR